VQIPILQWAVQLTQIFTVKLTSIPILLHQSTRKSRLASLHDVLHVLHTAAEPAKNAVDSSAQGQMVNTPGDIWQVNPVQTWSQRTLEAAPGNVIALACAIYMPS
jgi:hypothetical protein